MDTMLIELTNQKATGLLQELEELHLIKILKGNVKYEKLLTKSEELDEIREYRKAKAHKGNAIPFEKASEEIEAFSKK